MHLIYLLYLMEYIQLISEASRPPGPLVCLIRSVSSRQYDANKNQPKWIEDSPSCQQIIRKRLIIDRFSVYSYIYIGISYRPCVEPCVGISWNLVILAAIIWGDEAKALVLKELLDCSGGRHFHKMLSKYRRCTSGLRLEPIFILPTNMYKLCIS